MAAMISYLRLNIICKGWLKNKPHINELQNVRTTLSNDVILEDKNSA